MREHRDASDRLTFDFDKIEPDSYRKVTHSVVGHFHLEPASEITEGLDEIFQDYTVGDLVVGLEWDNWSGYVVCAKNTKSEQLATKIAVYISAHYGRNT